MQHKDALKQRLEALEKRLQEIAGWRDVDRALVREWSWVSGDGRIVRPGDAWPEVQEPAVFEAHAARPDAWGDEPTEVLLHPGGEALLLVDGHATGGLNPYHRRHTLPGRGPWSLRVEAVAHGLFGTSVPHPRLGRTELRRPDPEVRSWHDAWAAAWNAAAGLHAAGDSEVAWALVDLLQATLHGLPIPRTPTDSYLARVAPHFSTVATDDEGALSGQWEAWQFDAPWQPLGDAQRDAWREAHARFKAGRAELKRRHPGRGRFVAIGHAHIDLAWLWPFRETRRKARRTFATAAAALDRDPTDRFSQSMAQLYDYVREDDPELFERIKQHAAAGRWDVIGGMWVEPDGNLPSGEAWVRQFLHGQNYFMRHFGVTCKAGWLPDTFGYAGNLPQLFAGAGMTNFFTTKLNWNDTTDFPHDLYLWEGIDGTRITAHQLRNPDNGYNATVQAKSLLDSWENYGGKRHHEESLYVYGWGDGGGGPDDAQRARLREFADTPGMPEAVPGTVDAFFSGVKPNHLPVWRGEQYLQFHRGTYSSQARIKVLNRRLEHDLVEAEAASVLAGAHGLGDANASELGGLWEVLLRNQFHDVLPGSSVRSVNEVAERDMQDALARVRELRADALRALSQPHAGAHERVVVWNLDAHDRPLHAELPLPHAAALTLTTPEGTAVPWQPVGEGIVVSASEVRVPAMGFLTLDVTLGGSSDTSVPPGGGVTAEPGRLRNDVLDVQLTSDGRIASLVDLRSGLDATCGAGVELRVNADLPRVYEAWELDPDDPTTFETLHATGPAEVLEAGPERGRVRFTFKHANFTVQQDLTLVRGGTKLEVENHIRVHGRRNRLTLRIPTAVRSTHYTAETAFGTVERPRHDNTPWDRAMFEAPAHRYVTVQDGRSGLAILNDGRYGHAVDMDAVHLTLARAAIFPDPYADEGDHHFTYALMPFDLADPTGVVREAHRLNTQLHTVVLSGQANGATPGVRRSLVELPPNERLAALKGTAGGGAVILRSYEPIGRPGPAGEPKVPVDWTYAGQVDLLERPSEDTVRTLRPFGVVTRRYVLPAQAR
jgi:alpha-mannosidase